MHPGIICDINNLFDLCIKQNYFFFDNNIYIQNEGLPMGSPISPILANIFMDNLEKTILSSNNSRNILFWYRYVDDILACFVGSQRQLDLFFNYINNLHPKIKFTLEIEENNSINFWT